MVSHRPKMLRVRRPLTACTRDTADAELQATAVPYEGLLRLAPGLAIVAGGVAVAVLISRVVPEVSELVVAVVIGAVLTNAGLIPNAARPGLRFASSRLLRVGVVLLGLQLSAQQLVELGASRLLMVVMVVATTFAGTLWLGSLLKVSRGLSLLVATGFSICGASAIAAMDGVADTDEEDVAFAVALVTLCGTLAMATLPVVGQLIGLDAVELGTWIGSSVHDVGQVVAAAGSQGDGVLAAAIVVKLSRVVLLAPLVVGVTLWQGRHTGRRDRAATGGVLRPTQLLPIFVVGFLLAIALRSSGLVPSDWLSAAKTAQNLFLSAALVGLGTGVQFSRLQRLGPRPAVLGAISWFWVAGISLALIAVFGA